MIKSLGVLTLVGALVTVAAVSARAQNYGYFTGVTSSDPTVASNYSNSIAPTFGGTNTYNSLFSIRNQGNNPFLYSAALGTTVFNAYTYIANTTNSLGLGTLNMTGGSLSFGAVLAGNGSQNVLGDGLVNLSGGTLNFLNGNTSDSSSLWIGNNNGPGTVNVSGGTLTTQNGVIFGRDGASGILTLTGGLVNIQGTSGSAIGSALGGATGTGVLNLTAGVYEQTGSATITFTSGSHINFTTGSTAQLSLNGATTTSLQGLVTAGDIYKNGVVDTNTADYQYTTSGSQGILSLVPEPSTWAAVVSFLGMFAFSQRRRLAGMARSMHA